MAAVIYGPHANSRNANFLSANPFNPEHISALNAYSLKCATTPLSCSLVAASEVALLSVALPL